MANATLTGSGWLMNTDTAYNSTTHTSGGRIAPTSAVFYGLKVVSITGGTAPTVEICHGVTPTSPMVRSVAATAGAEIDRRASPDICPNGIYLNVTGNPRAIEVQVLWK